MTKIVEILTLPSTRWRMQSRWAEPLVGRKKWRRRASLINSAIDRLRKAASRSRPKKKVKIEKNCWKRGQHQTILDIWLKPKFFFSAFGSAEFPQRHFPFNAICCRCVFNFKVCVVLKTSTRGATDVDLKWMPCFVLKMPNFGVDCLMKSLKMEKLTARWLYLRSRKFRSSAGWGSGAWFWSQVGASCPATASLARTGPTSLINLWPAIPCPVETIVKIKVNSIWFKSTVRTWSADASGFNPMNFID